MKVACVMCTWEEEQMAPVAIESTKDFVDRYIVVDKASEEDTASAIRKCADEWKLDIEIYSKPNLILRDARMFAIEKVDEDWILIQDGDEIFHTDGPNSIFDLGRLLRFRNIVFLTQMTTLAGDFLHTSPPYRQPPHPFLYHNNDTFYPAELGGDIPEIIGVKIPLSKIYKFNCRVKSPRRTFLHQYWEEWCKTTNAFERFGSLEEYVKERLGSKNLDCLVKEWYEKYMSTLDPYDPKRYGYYPKVIREYIDRGKIRGYEKSGP